MPIKKTFHVRLEEVLFLSKFQSVKPSVNASIEYTLEDIPEGLTEEGYKQRFREELRQDYFKIKADLVRDFLDFEKQVKGGKNGE